MNKNKKRLMSLLCAAAMVTSVIPNAFAITDVSGKTPVVNYDFDGGDTHSYELLDGAYITDGLNDNGNAARVTSSGGYVKLDDKLTDDLSGSYTISVDVYPYTSGAWARIYDLGTGVSGDSDFKSLFLTDMGWNDGANSQPKFDFCGDILVGDNISLNSWSNITVVNNSGTGSIYINGELSSTVTLGANNSLSYISGSDANYLGKSKYAADAFYDGMIDNFRIYNSALTADEVYVLSDAEARDRENASKYERYFIETNFYDSSSNEIYQTKGGSTAKAKVKIKNYTLDEASFTIKAMSATSVITSAATGVLGITDETEAELSISIPTSADEVKIVVTDNLGNSYDAGHLPTADVSFPPASPEDTDETTFGAHDPTIFKDPVGGKYWAYSSHNLVYESDDLINWTEHDYTSSITVPDKAKEFIEANYTGTTVNGTYWAPDLLYVPESEYPYWFYLSVSCGLGGRNSVISLVKAKSPGLWDGEILDCGVVLASKENSSYNTNAIDANIYIEGDTNYFIWGSFWKGIHAAVLTDDGFIEGIDYTSDETILSTSAGFGSRLFSTPRGVFGPEGPYTIMNSDNDMLYMFTSYGWLGTNYNCRIARTDMTMSDILSQSNPHTRFVDHQSRRVGTTYADQSDKSELWGYKMIGSYKIGDGITYYGNGHNSALNDNGNWYYVQHSRKVADAAAYLQVRKMFWTKDGWPVVSPVCYAGEAEQKIPQSMILGTWDIATVGHTIYNTADVSACTSSDADLPVSSFEITLQEDGTTNFGTWSYDGDHTLTLNFDTNGSEYDNQYFKTGDTMTLYVLTGYDKDSRRSVLYVTGTDQNSIASFGIKSNAMASITEPLPLDTTPVVLDKSEGGNPALGFDTDGNLMYGGDPSATVIGDTVYLIVGHDTASGDAYKMPEYVCYTSKDMINWTCEGTIMKATDISWRSDDVSAWASQMIEYNGKYYLYYCTWAKSDGYQCIGVAVADSPTGPYTDIGQPLVYGASDTTENTSKWNDIDPTVWVETIDGVEHRYLAWGNGVYYMCELNEDMISIKGDIKVQTITNSDTTFTEAPWIYKRNGIYYTFYAAGWREAMAYATSKDLSANKWSYGGIIMPPTATSNTNHPAVIDFNGKTYFIYHNGALTQGSGYRRSVCIQELSFDKNGNVIPLTEMSTGLDGKAVTILTNDGEYVGHSEFTNPYTDASYPLSLPLIACENEDALNIAWEIEKALDGSGENYVSIQSVNKPGLYIGTISNNVVITPDDTGTKARYLTFKTVKGLNGTENTVSFESAALPGRYLTADNGKITLSYGRNADSCTFIAGGAVSPTPTPTIAPTPTPPPAATLTPDVNESFDTLSGGTLIYLNTTDTPAYTDIDGASLYVGTRKSSECYYTGFSIAENKGVSGNALTLMSQRWATSSRGARIAFNTPYIPNGGSASLDVKVNVASGTILYNDNTASDSGTKDITSYFTMGTYGDMNITISNTDEVYTRTMTINGETVFTDNTTSFPVIWGTLRDSNTTADYIYFDNLKITTKAPPSLDALNASQGKISFTLTGMKAYENIAVYAALYDNSNDLISVKIANPDITSDSFDGSIEYGDIDCALARLFVWDGMLPITEAKSVTVN